jgi:fatty acid-binding protein DegV
MLSDFKRKEKDGSLDVEYVKKYIEDTKKTMCGLLIVPDITFLKKGGRVSNFKAALIKLLKLNLLITLDYNGLKFCDKAKNIEQAITKAKKILKQKINFSNETLNRVRILLNKNADKKFLIDDIFLETKKSFNFSDNLEIAEIPSVIMVHTGPNYFVICLDCSKKN